MESVRRKKAKAFNRNNHTAKDLLDDNGQLTISGWGMSLAASVSLQVEVKILKSRF